MTAQELIAMLSTVPSDATVVYTFVDNCAPSERLYYDDATNTVYINESFDEEIDDDVDESNYDPYSGCDVYEVDEQY